ncbi:MAG: phosphate acyltransferase [Fodinibius sp.]|nr:phosphate acyltransferase [Fodinibius sp.]
MSNIIEQLRKRASELQGTVVLPETEDPRVLKAAAFLCKQQICSVTLLGSKNKIGAAAQKEKIQLSESIQYVNLTTVPFADELVAHLYHRRKHKGISRDEARKALADSLYLGASLVAIGRADACVAGSIAPTGNVIRAAIHAIGLKESVDIVSSTFLMALKDGRVLTYADCGVVPYPDASQLADIALESARTHRLLTRQEPQVAMLSFSTKGSAQHPKTALVTEALEIAQQRDPELEYRRRVPV